MPLLNARGQTLAGIAGQQASVNGVLLPVLGSCAFVDDDTVVGQSLDAARLLAVPIATPSAAQPIAAHGANLVVGGGGRWASFLASSPSQVDGSLGRLTGASVYAAGPDGSIAWKRSYQASSGLVLTGPTGSTIELASAAPTDLQVLGSTEAIWCEGPGQYRALGRAVPRPAVLTQRIRLVTVDGEDWLIVAGQNGGLFAHVDGQTSGYVLVQAPGEADSHDARVVNGEIVVVWSITMGERPQDVRTVMIDRTQPRVALTAPASGGSTTIVTPATPTAIQAHPRKLWLAPYYSFSERYGDAPDFGTYGNAATLVVDTADPTALPKTLDRVYHLGLPLVVDAAAAALAQPYLGSIVAWLASGAHLSDLGGAVMQALALHELPVIAYCDAPEDWPTSAPSWMSGRVWPAAQAYRRAGESIADFSTRMHALLATLESYGSYVVLTPRWDDVNGSQAVSFTTECMAAYADLIQQFPVCGLMPFADRRGHGLSADASLKAWAQAFSLANVGRPNRFDYWTPSASTQAATLKNKFGQTVEMVVLSSAEKSFLLSRIGG